MTGMRWKSEHVFNFSSSTQAKEYCRDVNSANLEAVDVIGRQKHVACTENIRWYKANLG